MKLVVTGFLLIGAAYLTYQFFHPQPTVYGKWRLNVDAMGDQLARQGVDQATIQEFKKSHGNGQTRILITKDAVIVTLMGKDVHFTYEIASVHENCTEMRVKESGNVLRNCVEGRTLRVYSRKDPAVEVYERISPQ